MKIKCQSNLQSINKHIFFFYILGDQIVAINNTQVPTIDTKSHTINNNNTSDEVRYFTQFECDIE